MDFFIIKYTGDEPRTILGHLFVMVILLAANFAIWAGFAACVAAGAKYGWSR